MRYCEICDKRLPEDSRKSRRYCSDTCRKRAQRARQRAESEPELQAQGHPGQ